MNAMRLVGKSLRSWTLPDPRLSAVNHSMNLIVRIPGSASQSVPHAIGLARMAPGFMHDVRGGYDYRTMNTLFMREGHGEDCSDVAIFPDLPQSLDVAIRLIEAVVDIPNIWVSMNARRVAGITKFWSVLICYRDSLDAPDPRQYCAGTSKRFTDIRGCPDHACLSPCQFICIRCMDVERDRGAGSVRAQLDALAVQAEVDWCPNLR
jgi:hypothetical protein